MRPEAEHRRPRKNGALRTWLRLLCGRKLRRKVPKSQKMMPKSIPGDLQIDPETVSGRKSGISILHEDSYMKTMIFQSHGVQFRVENSPERKKKRRLLAALFFFDFILLFARKRKFPTLRCSSEISSKKRTKKSKVFMFREVSQIQNIIFAAECICLRQMLKQLKLEKCLSFDEKFFKNKNWLMGRSSQARYIGHFFNDKRIC